MIEPNKAKFSGMGTAYGEAMTTWTVDPSHSSLNFAVRHIMISKVRGRFGAFTGQAVYDDATNAWKSAEATVEVASIDTREEKRDAHLRSADFFDVQKFPSITFKTSGVEARGDDKFLVRGLLTIHGVTKEIALDTEITGTGKDPWGGDRTAFSARGSISRKDFGMVWNQALEAGGIAVGDKVEIEIEAQVVKEK